MSENYDAVFWSLLKAGLWERDVQLDSNEAIDFANLFRVAEEQSVVGLMAAGIEHAKDKRIVKAEVLPFLKKVFSLEQRNRAMNGFVGELIKSLSDEGIYSILVKGQGVAQCYERPFWRACGDVDLYLSDDNYKKAKSFLIPQASKVESEYVREKHLGLTINSWLVELHGSLYSGLSSRVEKELDEIKQDTFYNAKVRLWENGDVPVFLLAVENDVFYVFTHILQHFYKGGIGLRQICDWCRLLWTYRSSLNVDILEMRLCRAGLMSEWKAFGAFAIEYLGMPVEAMPFGKSDTVAKSTSLRRQAARIKDFVMMSGNFGHNRDASYYGKCPYMVRKAISFGRRFGDLCRHARIFPLDSLRFMPYLIYNGVKSAIRGE
jgi:hypothetical protein